MSLIKFKPLILGAAFVFATGTACLAAENNSQTSSHSTSAGHGAKASGHDTKTVANSASGRQAAPAKKAGGHGAKHWGYLGPEGPENWGGLSADYALCGEGRMQSPIDISAGFGALGSPIEFDCHLTPLRILHNGHTIQVNYERGSGMTVGGKRYELLQFHFHTPSEHMIAGRNAPLEMHLVHKSADGQLAVVGIMMQGGSENPAVKEVWAHMPRKKSPEKLDDGVMVNAADFLPESHAYFRYMGSLTTPPCSEGVNWFVLTQPTEASAQQADLLARAVGQNARPVQSVNNRLVLTPTAN